MKRLKKVKKTGPVFGKVSGKLGRKVGSVLGKLLGLLYTILWYWQSYTLPSHTAPPGTTGTTQWPS